MVHWTVLSLYICSLHTVCAKSFPIFDLWVYVHNAIFAPHHPPDKAQLVQRIFDESVFCLCIFSCASAFPKTYEISLWEENMVLTKKFQPKWVRPCTSQLALVLTNYLNMDLALCLKPITKLYMVKAKKFKYWINSSHQ